MASGIRLSTLPRLSLDLQVLVTAMEQKPDLLPGKLLQYGTDSQPAMEDMMRMKGNQNTFPIVRQFRLLCQSLDVELEVIWRPRSHQQQQAADTLTKLVDFGDWSLHKQLYDKILAHPLLQGRQPTLDVFASATNTKVGHNGLPIIVYCNN